MGTAEDAANPLKHLWQKGPFHRKNLVGMTKLICQNVLPPQNAPCLQLNRMPLGPLGDFRTCRETPDCHLSSWSHHCTTLTQDFDKRIGLAGSSTTRDQWFLKCHWRGCMQLRPLGSKHSGDAIWPSSCCHIRAGGDGSC